MPPLDFPASPATGATYTGPNGVIWSWDGLAGVPELAKVLAGGFTIGSVGFLGASIRSEMNCAAGAETGAEAAISRSLHAFGENAVPSLVLHVLCVRGCPQIDPAVVISDAVDVIDLRRFLAADHLEDDTVNRPENMIDFDQRVASVMVVPGDVSRMPGIPPFPFVSGGEVFSGAHSPAQDPGCRIVAETHLQVTTVRQNPVEVWHA